jgi:excisionase family DNA binding protein
VTTRQDVAQKIAAGNDLPLTLSTTQAAKLCGVSPTTIRKWVRNGLPTLPFDGDHRFSTEALREYLKSGPAA